jgi:AcrR family transcriptional regulator
MTTSRATATVARPGTRPLRRDAAANRQRLLDAAGQVFADHGLEAGVEEVARVAGVGMGTLYRRFPSKQALIDELVGGMRRALLDIAVDASACADGTGLEQLLVRTGQLQASQPGCLPGLWAHSEAGLEAIAHFRALLVELLHSAQAHGRIREDLTNTDITMILWSVSAVIERTGSVAPKAWRRHLELLVAGLRPVGDGPFAGALSEVAMSEAQSRRLSAAAR